MVRWWAAAERETCGLSGGVSVLIGWFSILWLGLLLLPWLDFAGRSLFLFPLTF